MLCLSFVFLYVASHLVAASTFIATFVFPGNQPDIAIMDTGYNPIIHPSTGDLVTVGIPYDITWNRTNHETINFKLFTAQSGTEFTYTGFEFQLLDGFQDYYEWNLNPDIASGDNYVLRLNRDAISPTFAITNSASGTSIAAASSTTAILPGATLPSRSSSSGFSTSVTKQTTQTTEPATTSDHNSSSSNTTPSGTISTSSTTSTNTVASGPVPTETGTSNPPPSGGNGGLSQDSKIALGVGISFGIFAPVGAYIAWLQYKNSKSRHSGA
ncbi:hypothetical protein AA313_de0200525 [Arthrobotrys entomopaga]|nr:hypothetical protein AA313_de0200525 [Arthrobotrys entomopaga]